MEDKCLSATGIEKEEKKYRQDQHNFPIYSKRWKTMYKAFKVMPKLTFDTLQVFLGGFIEEQGISLVERVNLSS